MMITEKNKFFGLICGFVVHFDTNAELHIHSNDVIVKLGIMIIYFIH
ncbi:MULTISPECIES: hypothetical protein [Bacillus]|nr:MULTISPECIES: hypothetical protein [Bacillus]MCY8641253.1 hypothetical protein [Bacillus haynesii]MEC0491449.1 hypothetical protein [Bacillus licheniformis]